jgi:hypothetical protein
MVFFFFFICCFLTGSFLLYTAGIFDSFSGITLFVASLDPPLIRCIFRRGSDPQTCFCIHHYLFTFSRNGANADIVHCMVSHGDFRMTFCIFGIDTAPNCNTYSNLDFISFIWKYLDRFDFIKYSMTFVRRTFLSLPELCLKYYKAVFGGWRTNAHCSTGIIRFHTTIRHLFPPPCLRTSSFKCRLCTRQPPSLLGSASHTLFHLIHDLGRFTHTRETTQDQDILAVRSKKTHIPQLLPPYFPTVQLLFQCRVFSYKLHLHCSDVEGA